MDDNSKDDIVAPLVDAGKTIDLGQSQDMGHADSVNESADWGTRPESSSNRSRPKKNNFKYDD